MAICLPRIDQLSNLLAELKLYGAFGPLRQIIITKRRDDCVKMPQDTDFLSGTGRRAHFCFLSRLCVHCNHKKKWWLADARALEGRLQMCQNATDECMLARQSLSFEHGAR